jgi:hypothetical protein
MKILDCDYSENVDIIEIKLTRFKILICNYNLTISIKATLLS